jgi:hypothetical protein
MARQRELIGPDPQNELIRNANLTCHFQVSASGRQIAHPAIDPVILVKAAIAVEPDETRFRQTAARDLASLVHAILLRDWHSRTSAQPAGVWIRRSKHMRARLADREIDRLITKVPVEIC